MPILKQKEIYDPSKGNPVGELKKQLTEVLAIEKEWIAVNEKLSQSLNLVKKSSDGAEAKKLVTTTNKLNKSNQELTALQKERISVNNQLQKTLAKNLSAQEKNVKVLAKGKLAIQERNRVLKQEAILTSKVTGEYTRQSTLLNKLRKDYKDLILVEGKETAELKKKRLAIEKLDSKLKKLDNSLGQNQRSVGKYGDALKGVGRQLVGALGITAGITMLVGVLKNAGKIFIDFEKSSSTLAAILGKTKAQIKSLTEQAKMLGSTTAFTASQILEADTALAKLGFTSKQIEQAIPGVLDLAAATGTDLAQSAELAAATLRIFNLDASEMGRVSDVLAKSTTISSLSMEKLAIIMPTVGKTAQIAGVSLEKTAALAGTLTDRGLDASSAATSLRNIFLELSKKGITWNEAMAKINASTDKNKTSMDLFGKRAAAAGVILSETATSTDGLTTALENANGAAKEMADTMLDNLAGDLTIAQSAWEGFILSLEDGEGVLSGLLRGITQYFTGLLEALANFNNGVSKFDAFTKKSIGFTDEMTSALKRQKAELEAITDKEVQLILAKGSFQKLQRKYNEYQLDALRASNKGNTKEIAVANLKLEYTKALIDQLKGYIPELREKSKIEEEEIIITNELTAAQKRKLQIEKELNDERIRRANIAAENEQITLINTDLIADTEGIEQELFEIKEKWQLEKQKELNKNIADEQNRLYLEELARLEEIENAKADIRESLISESSQFASDIFKQDQDSKLAEIKSGVEAEKKIAQDNLDKGVINQIQFNEKINELNKKERNAEAKAEKKKALFDIAIATVVNVAKAGFITPKAIAIAIAGAIQAAFVAAKPVPKFEKGGLVGGKRHRDGGTLIEAEKDEFVVNRHGYMNAPETVKAINNGLFRDIDAKKTISKGYDFNILSSKLDRLNSISNKMLEVQKGAVYSWQEGNLRYIRFGDGITYKEVING